MAILRTDKHGQMSMWSVVLPFPIPAHKARDIDPRVCDEHLRLMPVLRKVRLFDALVYTAVRGLSEWRLEFVQVEQGHPHYRLYHTDLSVRFPCPKLIGIVDIQSQQQHEIAVHYLCTYLWIIGYRENARLELAGAMTPELAWKHHLPILFYASSGRREERLLVE